MQVEQVARTNSSRIRSLGHPHTFRHQGKVYCTIEYSTPRSDNTRAVFDLENQTIVGMDLHEVVEVVNAKLIVEPK